MVREINIDVSRIGVLRDIAERTLGEVRLISDRAKELTEARNAAESELRRIESGITTRWGKRVFDDWYREVEEIFETTRRPPDAADDSDAARRWRVELAAAHRKLMPLKRRLAELVASREAVSERREASAALLRRCVQWARRHGHEVEESYVR